MRWTTHPPTEPGWYWVRPIIAKTHRIVEVRESNLGVLQFYYGIASFDIDLAYVEWWPELIQPPEEE